MKTMNFMKGFAFAAMMIMSMGMMAQPARGRMNDGRGTAGLSISEHGISRSGDMASHVGRDNREMMESRDSRAYDKRDNRQQDRRFNDRRHETATPVHHGGMYADRGHMAPPPHHTIPARYVNVVRYMPDGRWGYLRGNRWYYYDTYFEPDYYFAHPVRHFHAHRLGPVGKALVAGAVIGGIITALVR